MKFSIVIVLFLLIAASFQIVDGARKKDTNKILGSGQMNGDLGGDSASSSGNDQPSDQSSDQQKKKMDVPVYIVEELKCGQCGMFLSRGPVYLQHDGATTCSRCLSLQRRATRNKQYEAAAKLLQLRFPCRYQDLGCRETVPFVAEGQDVAHEAVCEYRQYVCPVLGSSRCAWLGPRSQIRQHCRLQHSDHELLETCTRCGDVTGKLYRDAGGWRCERCAPAKVACKEQAQGCAHQDIPEKCWKHEWYFCQQRTRCYICRADIARGTLAAHYAAAHRDVTHGAGSTWRATSAYGQRCLVTCPAGTAVCCYTLNHSQFDLYVHIPVPSERLCEFRCEVRATQLTKGRTRTYTPDISYNRVADWNICLNQDDFPDWNCEFDVCVNIIGADLWGARVHAHPIHVFGCFCI